MVWKLKGKLEVFGTFLCDECGERVEMVTNEIIFHKNKKLCKDCGINEGVFPSAVRIAVETWPWRTSVAKKVLRFEWVLRTDFYEDHPSRSHHFLMLAVKEKIRDFIPEGNHPWEVKDTVFKVLGKMGEYINVQSETAFVSNEYIAGGNK